MLLSPHTNHSLSMAKFEAASRPGVTDHRVEHAPFFAPTLSISEGTQTRMQSQHQKIYIIGASLSSWKHKRLGHC